ncbi:MAG: hypothetical protein RIR07_512 [Bacteroidota bacterium]|jgi:hypothetical protein
MWIKTFILSILMLVASRVDACDACGCGPGAAFLQAMPQFGRRSVDLSASLRGGRSEFLPFAALRYQHAVGDRSALWVQVPVSAAYYRGYWSDGTYAEHLLGGLGDPNVGAMRRWILPQGQLQAGAWLGIPLGAYRLRSIQGTLHPSGYQPGNGAFSGGIWTNLWLGTTERAWLLSGQASASAVNRYGVARPASASLQAVRMRGRETEHSATRLAAGLSASWTDAQDAGNAEVAGSALQLQAVVMRQFITTKGMTTVQLQGVLLQSGDPRFRQWAGISVQYLRFVPKRTQKAASTSDL